MSGNVRVATFLLVVVVGMVLLWVYAPAQFSYAGWTLLLIAAGAGAYYAAWGGGESSDGSAPPIVNGRALIAVITMAALIYGVFYLAAATSDGRVAVGYFGIVLGVAGIAVLLAVAWLQFGAELQALQHQPGWTGLLAQLLFALPCAIAWTAQYFADDFKSTAPATLLLLAVEFGLLAAYLFRRRIGAAAAGALSVLNVFDDGRMRGYVTTPLQTDRVFLNHETRLGNRPLPEGAAASMLTPAQSLGQNQDYRVTVELFLHPLEIGADADALSVLRYADGATRRGCPSVFFEGAGATKKLAVDNQTNAAQLQIYLTNQGDGDPFLIAVPLQRWVRLAFYYTRAQVDVFMDDRLVHSMVWTPDTRPVFGPGDQFVLGSPVSSGSALGSLRRLSVDTPRIAATGSSTAASDAASASAVQTLKAQLAHGIKF